MPSSAVFALILDRKLAITVSAETPALSVHVQGNRCKGFFQYSPVLIHAKCSTKMISIFDLNDFFCHSKQGPYRWFLPRNLIRQTTNSKCWTLCNYNSFLISIRFIHLLGPTRIWIYILESDFVSIFRNSLTDGFTFLTLSQDHHLDWYLWFMISCTTGFNKNSRPTVACQRLRLLSDISFSFLSCETWHDGHNSPPIIKDNSYFLTDVNTKVISWTGGTVFIWHHPLGSSGGMSVLV